MIRAVVPQQDIEMKGKIKHFNPFAPGNPLGPNKKRKRGEKKKKKPTGSTSRDYRGIDGVLKDAEGK
jgi:hypothetical protein